jgi:hypothetical protein
MLSNYKNYSHWLGKTSKLADIIRPSNKRLTVFAVDAIPFTFV